MILLCRIRLKRQQLIRIRIPGEHGMSSNASDTKLKSVTHVPEQHRRADHCWGNRLREGLIAVWITLPDCSSRPHSAGIALMPMITG